MGVDPYAQRMFGEKDAPFGDDTLSLPFANRVGADLRLSEREKASTDVQSLLY